MGAILNWWRHSQDARILLPMEGRKKLCYLIMTSVLPAKDYSEPMPQVLSIQGCQKKNGIQQ